METSGLVLILVWLATLLFIFKKFRTQKPKKIAPPGPKPWPIFGHLLQLGDLPHITIYKFTQIYGEIMQLKFGSKTVFVVSSPKMAEEVLKTHDASLASRPPVAAGKYTGYDFQDMTWAPYGPHWRIARKVYLTELFNPKRLDSFEYIRRDERRGFLSRIYDQRGKPVVLSHQIRKSTLSSISRVVLSDKYFSDSKTEKSLVSFDELHDMIDEWMVLNGVLNYGDWIPWLQFFDVQGLVKRMKKLQKKFDRFHDVVIADHYAKRGDKNSAPRDMVDVLLRLTDDDADPEMKLTLNGVKALVHDLMPGGTDTSAVSIEWALHELLRNPEIMKKLKEELDREIGPERWVEEEDYTKLPYLEAIIKETLRLHPLSPMLAPHYAIEDCNIAGYEVAKGTVFLIHSWGIGRHPDYWENPDVFWPERFLQDQEIGMLGQNFLLLPFGSGRRRCPGYNLGLRIVRTTIANLLHGFDWTLPEGVKPEDVCMEERYGLTVCPRVPVAAVPQPRLPIHLYQR